MQIERQETDNIIIKVSSKIDKDALQGIIEYLEATANSKATQEDVDALADEVNRTWWSENREKYIRKKSSSMSI